MVANGFNEIITKVLSEHEPEEWVHLASIGSGLKELDPSFSPMKYGSEKLMELLVSASNIVELKKDGTKTPPIYSCRLIKNTEPTGSRSRAAVAAPVNKVLQRQSGFTSLYQKYRDQPNSEVFAHFGWDPNRNENWETPFARLASLAKNEDWNYKRGKLQKENQNYPILMNYLNYTFLRIQQLGLIAYSEDKSKACFNTGLITRDDKDIYITFFKNKYAQKNNQPAWVLYNFFDSYSEDLKDFILPEVATYVDDSSELVFDLKYDIDINVSHIIEDNIDRLPDELRKLNRRSLLLILEGVKSSLKTKILRNYKVAIPHWHHDKIQLLLPLYVTDDDNADLALVADKDNDRKIYRIRTILSMEQAYNNARLICRPDREWLNP